MCSLIVTLFVITYTMCVHVFFFEIRVHCVLTNMRFFTTKSNGQVLKSCQSPVNSVACYVLVCSHGTDDYAVRFDVKPSRIN